MERQPAPPMRRERVEAPQERAQTPRERAPTARERALAAQAQAARERARAAQARAARERAQVAQAQAAQEPRAAQTPIARWAHRIATPLPAGACNAWATATAPRSTTDRAAIPRFINVCSARPARSAAGRGPIAITPEPIAVCSASRTPTAEPIRSATRPPTLA